jgi:SRSO17 transposase
MIIRESCEPSGHAGSIATIGGMTSTNAGQRLEQYLDQIGERLGDKRRRASFATYAMGLLSESERKSMEPIGARASATPAQASAAHQRLHHFIANTSWSDNEVRLEAARYAIAAMEERDPVVAWVIDDTGFLKQGKHSVGVQRQYTGSAGKTANCQIGVSLSVTTRTEHLPIDFALFLPESWTEDPERRLEVKIPEETTFQTKHDLALGMIEQAIRAQIPGTIVLADSFYGHSRPFRETVHLLGFDYGMAIYSNDKMQLVDRHERLRGELRTAKEIALALGPRAFRRCTWREGTNRKLSSRFALCRVKVPVEQGLAARAEWLLIEWSSGDKEPTHFFLTTLPRSMSKKEIVRLIKERYRTEQVYEELKGELGLDHFEGRSFPGWHHHVSVVLCVYAFLVAERSRAFPPRPEGRVIPVRSIERLELHFPDSIATVRLTLLRIIVRWLPRCPLCHHEQPARGIDAPHSSHASVPTGAP